MIRIKTIFWLQFLRTVQCSAWKHGAWGELVFQKKFSVHALSSCPPILLEIFTNFTRICYRCVSSLHNFRFTRLRILRSNFCASSDCVKKTGRSSMATLLSEKLTWDTTKLKCAAVQKTWCKFYKEKKRFQIFSETNFSHLSIFLRCDEVLFFLPKMWT